MKRREKARQHPGRRTRGSWLGDRIDGAGGAYLQTWMSRDAFIQAIESVSLPPR